MRLQLQERTLQAAHGPIRYLTGGSGPLMVLCHGFLGSSDTFLSWTDALASRRTVLALDLPGCGESAPLPERHSCEALAQTILSVVDAVRPGEQFGLTGVCLGTSVVGGVVRAAPDRVREVILHTPLVNPHLMRRRYRMQAAVMMMPGVFNGITWCGHQPTVSKLYKRLVIEGKDVDPEEARLNFQNQLRVTPRATREWLLDSLGFSWVEEYATLTIPILVIAAQHDRLLDLTLLRQLVEHHPSTILAIIEAAGHGWNASFMERQLVIMEHFLDRNELPDVAWLCPKAS